MSDIIKNHNEIVNNVDMERRNRDRMKIPQYKEERKIGIESCDKCPSNFCE